MCSSWSIEDRLPVVSFHVRKKASQLSGLFPLYKKILLFFGRDPQQVGSQFPDQGSNLCLLAMEACSPKPCTTREVLLAFQPLIRTLIPSMRGTSSGLNYFPPNTIILGLGFQHMNFGETQAFNLLYTQKCLAATAKDSPRQHQYHFGHLLEMLDLRSHS